MTAIAAEFKHPQTEAAALLSALATVIGLLTYPWLVVIVVAVYMVWRSQHSSILIADRAGTHLDDGVAA